MESPTIYDADNRIRISPSAWREMLNEIREYRELIKRLLFRGIAGQFRQSFLGYFWVALPPIATTIVFTMLRQAKVVNVPMESTGLPYALFALIGTTIWGFFRDTTTMATASIQQGGTLVSKIYFPREVLVLSSVGNALVGILIRSMVIGLSFVLMGYSPCWQIAFVPVLLLPLFAFGLGLGFIFAPINTVMHDMIRMLNFVFQFGMFVVPTVYPTPVLDDVSSSWEIGLYWLHSLNPVSHFIHATHQLVETGSFVMDAGLVCSMIIGFATLLIGWRFFHVCEPLLAERM